MHGACAYDMRMRVVFAECILCERAVNVYVHAASQWCECIVREHVRVTCRSACVCMCMGKLSICMAVCG